MLVVMVDRMAQLQKLLAMDPNDAFVLYGLAQEHAKREEHAQSIAYYDKCLAVDPLYCYAYYHKARSQQAEGDLAGAVATLRSGLDAAKKARDEKARSEIEGLIEMLT